MEKWESKYFRKRIRLCDYFANCNLCEFVIGKFQFKNLFLKRVEVVA